MRNVFLSDKFNLIRAYVGVILIALFLCVDIGYLKIKLFNIDYLLGFTLVSYVSLYVYSTVRHIRRIK